MKHVDVLVIGAGIAGSVAAMQAAKFGFTTCLVEKKKVPRYKVCSGIQFGYFEKLVGHRFPKDILCSNEITKIGMTMPSGRHLGINTRAIGFKVFNFWRDTFDHWLNERAEDAGATLRDGTSFRGFSCRGDKIVARLSCNDVHEEVEASHLVVADGLYSATRRAMRPGDFCGKPYSMALNLYVKPDDAGSLDPHKLYMYYNIDFGEYMFAWVYFKDEYLVIGSGSRTGVAEAKAMAFFNHVKATHGFQGEICKKEGFGLTQVGAPYLGTDNVLLAGDAAGLCDLYRGVGMDCAALSARHAAAAIHDATASGRPAGTEYAKRMQPRLDAIQENGKRRTDRCTTNDELQRVVSKNLARAGGGMVFWNAVNKLLPAEKVVLLPP